MDLGKFHVLLVHFPIALTLAAAAADILWVWRRKDFYRQAGFYCLLLAAASAIPTVFTGDQHLDAQQYTGVMAQIGETHGDMGMITLGLVAAAAVVRAVRKNRPRRWWLAGYVVLIAAAAVMVSITAHWGGKLTFGPDYLLSLFQSPGAASAALLSGGL
jgi:uncharacterized membrane protein